MISSRLSIPIGRTSIGIIGLRFFRGMARSHVPHDGTGHTRSRPRERPASCCHLPVPDVRRQRTGPKSSERRRYQSRLGSIYKSNPSRSLVVYARFVARHSVPGGPAYPSTRARSRLSGIKTIGTPAPAVDRPRSIRARYQKKKKVRKEKKGRRELSRRARYGSHYVASRWTFVRPRRRWPGFESLPRCPFERIDPPAPFFFSSRCSERVRPCSQGNGPRRALRRFEAEYRTHPTEFVRHDPE